MVLAARLLLIEDELMEMHPLAEAQVLLLHRMSRSERCEVVAFFRDRYERWGRDKALAARGDRRRERWWSCSRPAWRR